MLRVSKISFPGLGIGEFSVESQAFEIFGVSVAWYAIFITLGMVGAIVYTLYRAKKIGITVDDVIDFAIFVIPIGIIGARAYYVLTKLDEYSSFAEVINIRNGGLAIYGGIIAGVLTALVVAYVKKISFLAFADCCTPGVIFAQAMGRWGNFMNGEAYGYETDWFCRMGLQNMNTLSDFGTSAMVYVHPTFLYESLWNLIGFVLINIFYKRKSYDGQVLLWVFGWYGLGRFLIEGLRTDSLYIPGTALRISQVLAILIFAICLTLLIYFRIRKPARPMYVKPIKEKKEKN